MQLNPIEKYKLSNLKNSTPIQQLLINLDNVIVLLYSAKKALDENDYISKHTILMEANDIFLQLKSVTNTKDASEAVMLLDKFYLNAIMQIHKIDISNSNSDDICIIIKSVKQVRNVIKEFYQQIKVVK